ncbi:MAG TPA: hypothetical protein VMF69_20745 [Gemmataceae bacterium]|nr:hypothetical protein [Gemmataceae bacterium]
MENRIHRIEVRDRSLDPVSAEVWISVLPEHHTATTEVRGRLMGPRCLYSNTVEVAYPLRPLPPSQKTLGLSGLTVLAVIPEASLWEPQCPFLYQGPIELWQDGQRCDRIVVSHGLRSLQRKERGLCVNGRPLTLRGRRIAACSDEEATLWRQSGYNLLIAPVGASSLAVWERADRFGFLVLGQLGEDADETRLVETLRSHASCLGWLSAECQALNAEEAVGWYMAHGNPEAM